jgi:hypothetical protein
MRFGILTSVRRALLSGDEVWGFRDGWQGVVFGNYEFLILWKTGAL